MAEYVCDISQDYPDAPYESDDFSGTLERRERVTRCCDCAYSHKSKTTGLLMCNGPIQGAYSDGADVLPDGFCAWGEPRGGK